jgi:hypothetical protein
MATYKITCCKDCATRHPGCHASCEKYIQQKAELDSWNAEQRKQQDIKYGLDGFLFDSIERTNRQINYRSKYRRKR